MTGQRRLTAYEEAYIRQAFCDNLSVKKVCDKLGLSSRCIRQRYQKLRGYPMRPRQLEPTLLANRKGGGTHTFTEKWFRKKTNKPLVDKSRFYHSDFEPV